jgi:hypothetical protein
MTHNEAIDYCNGGRLPTALELAQLAIKQGGKKYAQPSAEHDHSYKPVDARNPDGSLDHFLFSYRNYPYGAGGMGSDQSEEGLGSKEELPFLGWGPDDRRRARLPRQQLYRLRRRSRAAISSF